MVNHLEPPRSQLTTHQHDIPTIIPVETSQAGAVDCYLPASVSSEFEPTQTRTTDWWFSCPRGPSPQTGLQAF